MYRYYPHHRILLYLMVTVIMSNVVLMVEVTALRAYANFLIARVPKVATAFSGSPLDAVSICLVVYFSRLALSLGHLFVPKLL